MERDLFGEETQPGPAPAPEPDQLQFSFKITPAGAELTKPFPDLAKLQDDYLGTSTRLKDELIDEFSLSEADLQFRQVPDVYCYVVGKKSVHSIVPNPGYVNPFKRKSAFQEFLASMRQYRTELRKHKQEEHARRMSFERLKRERILELRKLRGIVAHFPTKKLE